MQWPTETELDNLFYLMVLHDVELSSNAHDVQGYQPSGYHHPRPTGEGRVEDPGLVEVLLHTNNLGIFYLLEARDCEEEEESEADLRDGWDGGKLKILQKARHHTAGCIKVSKLTTFMIYTHKLSSRLETRKFERDPF